MLLRGKILYQYSVDIFHGGETTRVFKQWSQGVAWRL